MTAEPESVEEDPEVQKLAVLRDQGILTDQEFENARKRLVAKHR